MKKRVFPIGAEDEQKAICASKVTSFTYIRRFRKLPSQEWKSWTKVLEDKWRLILDPNHRPTKCVLQIKGRTRALMKVSKTCTRQKSETLSWKPKVWDEATRGETFRWFITSTSNSKNDMDIPNLVKRHSYRGIKQPLKEMHTLSSRPTDIIS